MITFIEEEEKRHFSQSFDKHGKPDYLDYSISLPERSLNEICRWVNQFMYNAQVVEPLELVERYRLRVKQLASLYNE